jgi:hypothetical protein
MDRKGVYLRKGFEQLAQTRKSPLAISPADSVKQAATPQARTLTVFPRLPPPKGYTPCIYRDGNSWLACWLSRSAASQPWLASAPSPIRQKAARVQLKRRSRLKPQQFHPQRSVAHQRNCLHRLQPCLHRLYPRYHLVPLLTQLLALLTHQFIRTNL